MGKKEKKISINLTEEDYKLLERLSVRERRTISELCALIVMDNARLLLSQDSSKRITYVPKGKGKK